MWILVVVCVVATFIIAVAAQLEVFNLRITQLIRFKRITDGS